MSNGSELGKGNSCTDIISQPPPPPPPPYPSGDQHKPGVDQRQLIPQYCFNRAYNPTKAKCVWSVRIWRWDEFIREAGHYLVTQSSVRFCLSAGEHSINKASNNAFTVHWACCTLLNPHIIYSLGGTTWCALWINKLARTHMHARTHERIHAYTHTHTHTHTHSPTHTHTHTHTRTHTQKDMHIHKRACRRTYTHTYTQRHTQPHTHTHTHVYAHIEWISKKRGKERE